jgi:hypothetical protein
MTLLNIKTTDLLIVWADLVEAYHGVNGFGSDTCEIYAFRIGRLNESTCLKEDFYKSEIEARDNLFELLDIFKESYDCDFELILSRTNSEANLKGLKKIKEVWLGQKHGFSHREAIRVIKKSLLEEKT